MNCHFCNSEMIEKKVPCPFCEKHKVENCTFCKSTGKVTVVQCTNPNCEPPDPNLEPWDDEE
jgi:hypothetical protein